MGVLFSNNEQRSVIARYENGVVYSLDGGRVLGRYDAGYIFCTGDQPIAVYCENKVYDTKNEMIFLHAEQGCVLCNDVVIAKYQGSTEGACAAAFLLYEEKLTGKESLSRTQSKLFENRDESIDEDIPNISLKDLWVMFNVRCPGFLKVIVALLLLASVYYLYQFPATITLLLESGTVGVIMLVLWGGAFLLGLRKCWAPEVEDFSAFLGLLWRTLIPYLHSSWIMIVFTCINAAYQGYFSSMYLSSALLLFPPAAFYLTLPLFVLQLVRVLYVLHKQSK